MSTFWLKIIAITTMAIDHVGAVFFPKYVMFRMIGRLAFPIFAFLIAEGAYYTRDINKYIGRMGVFALLSEIPFDLAFYGQILDWRHQNVMWTFFLALVAVWIDKNYAKGHDQGGYFVVGAVLAMVAASFLKSDYQAYGVILVLLFYKFRHRPLLKFGGGGVLMAAFGLEHTRMRIEVWKDYYRQMELAYPLWQNRQDWLVIGDYIQALACLAFPLLATFNGKKGPGLKYFFYAFYPGHLLVIGLVAFWQ